MPRSLHAIGEERIEICQYSECRQINGYNAHVCVYKNAGYNYSPFVPSHHMCGCCEVFEPQFKANELPKDI